MKDREREKMQKSKRVKHKYSANVYQSITLNQTICDAINQSINQSILYSSHTNQNAG